MAGPGDEMAAGAAGRGPMRASHADREQVIEALKDAFVHGRLTKDELDTRAGRALAARTCAELAALTADLPGPASTQPVPKPARAQPPQPAGKAVRWAAFGLIIPALLTATFAVPDPTPTDNQPIGKILSLITLIYLIAWLVAGAQMLGTWHQQRSRPPAGRELTEPGSPAVGE